MGSPPGPGTRLRRLAGALAALLLASAPATADWEQRTPTSSPPPRLGHAMAHDPIGGGILLFGGRNDSNLLGDTWRWDGSTWTRLTPTSSPSPRAYHAMALDVCRGRVLLFGGSMGSSQLAGDTWEWDGATWVRLVPQTSPTPRCSSAMGSDLRRRRTLLFGGDTGSPRYRSNDTWEWNGTTWTQVAPDQNTSRVEDPNYPYSYTYPSRRFGHALAYDPFRGRVAMVAGRSELGDNFWSWDGSRWVDDNPYYEGPNPYSAERLGPGWVYDANRGGVVLFGGFTRAIVDTGGEGPVPDPDYTPPPYFDTFDWTGREFVELELTTAPPVREYLAMAFDPVRRRTVMFGGRSEVDVNPSEYLADWRSVLRGDTWELVSASREPEILFGAGGPGGDLDLATVPDVSVVEFGEAPPFTWNAYTRANGELRPAAGDLDGDGAEEIVLGLGTYTASGGWMPILDDANHGFQLLRWVRVPWAAYNAANGSTRPQCGDIDGDGRSEIVVGLGTYRAWGGLIAVFDDAASNFAFRRFLNVGWAAYNAANGETRPAVGDVDGDGKAELVVGFGTYAANGGWLRVFEDMTAGFAGIGWLRLDSSVYNQFDGATYPAIGNLDADAPAELAIGEQAFPGRGGWIRLVDDRTTNFARLSWINIPWRAYIDANGEVRPSLEHTSPGETAELICSFGYFPSRGGWVAVYPQPLNGRIGYWVRDPDAAYNASNGSEWAVPADLSGDAPDSP